MKNILNFDLPKGLRLQLLDKYKKLKKCFGLNKVLIISNDSIEIVSKYIAEYHKNKYTGRFNKTNVLSGAWLSLDDRHNGLQVIDLRQ